MTETVSIPMWLAATLAALSVWAVLDRILVPCVRSLIRGRVNRMVDQLNTRLQLGIPAFHRTKRRVLIDRLTNDPAVQEALAARSRETGQSRDDLSREVEGYAREIVPSFNAYAYFRIAYRVAHRTAQVLYRMRLGYADDVALSKIEPDASIVFVMNHRSNMDYVIVAYMVANRTALSYAVGEWARIWPLAALIRSLGAYFVRRQSGNQLYRRVLARYVQMATEGGVVQAVYPEGGLSRDGRLREPKLGLISYILSAFDPDGRRDLVFIPVGLNYDRVLEDRSLIEDLEPRTASRGRVRVSINFLRFVAKNIGLMLRGGWYRFGYACVNFGSPVSMREYTRVRGVDFRALDAASRTAAVQQIGDQLLQSVATAIPVLPVPLVATVFVRQPGKRLSGLEIKAQVQSLIDEAQQSGAYVHIPRADREYAITVGLRTLLLRHFVDEQDGLYIARADAERALRYYANSIEQFLRGGRQGPAAGAGQARSAP